MSDVAIYSAKTGKLVVRTATVEEQNEIDARETAWPQQAYEQAYAEIEAQRRARYQTETDGMYFDAIREGGDLTDWQAAVDQIKADLPWPEAPQ